MPINEDEFYNRPMEPTKPSAQWLTAFDDFMKIVEHLRSLEGCPWDLEQTHESLKRNLIEESYEVLEAIDSQDPRKLSEELGDILLQVALHADIAKKAGHFAIEDVLAQINQKLVRRHPHVFGNTIVTGVREVEDNWERLKEAERGSSSPVAGIPQETPSLAYAQLMQDRVAKAGFDWEDISGVLAKICEELDEFEEAENPDAVSSEYGDVLFSLVNLARWHGIHAEEALRQANNRFKQRYIKMEALATIHELDFRRLPLNEKEDLWQQAKRIVG